MFALRQIFLGAYHWISRHLWHIVLGGFVLYCFPIFLLDSADKIDGVYNLSAQIVSWAGTLASVIFIFGGVFALGRYCSNGYFAFLGSVTWILGWGFAAISGLSSDMFFKFPLFEGFSLFLAFVGVITFGAARFGRYVDARLDAAFE